jgi:hypothetical protein
MRERGGEGGDKMRIAKADRTPSVMARLGITKNKALQVSK